MTPARQPQDCAYLLRRGMSVLCIDSTDPSRKNCDHCISPQCFATHTSPPAPRPPCEECIHYALCCSAQIQNASGCVGKKDCKFYATHASSPAPAERLGFTEFCNVHCDKHECCTNECERSAYEAAKAEREQVRKVLIIEKGKQKLAFRDCWDENAIKFIKDWAQSLHLIEESLRAQQGGVSE